MVSEKKKALVQKLAQQLSSYPVIALVNLENLPAKPLQALRTQLLQKDILLVMTRKRLLQLALSNSRQPNINQLIEKIKGVPALLLSQENPFNLYSILQKNKSPASAKPHQIAPRDIIVRAGPTNFAPGPLISELASVGLKTKVEGGKLAIVQDTTLAKEGEPISPKLAEILKRLDIQPMEIGLNLVAAWENSLVFDAQHLRFDEKECFHRFLQAYQQAFNLTFEIAYPTPDNIELFLQKAFREAKTLALEQNILTDLTLPYFLAQSQQQALSLKETAKLLIPEKEEPPAQAKEEIKEKIEEKIIAPAQPETPSSGSPLLEDKPFSEIPSAAELIRATQEKFGPPGLEKNKKNEKECPLTAEELVQQELEAARIEKPQMSKEMAEAESLFEKLKQEGTLKRKEKTAIKRFAA